MPVGKLPRIEVSGGTEAHHVKFYTDLRHALLGRRIVSDVDGFCNMGSVRPFGKSNFRFFLLLTGLVDDDHLHYDGQYDEQIDFQVSEELNGINRFSAEMKPDSCPPGAVSSIGSGGLAESRRDVQVISVLFITGGGCFLPAVIG